jgi:hypothetical protein
MAKPSEYWEKMALFMRDKASLQAKVTELEEKVTKIEKERNDALAQAYKAGVERDNARGEVAQFRAAQAKERVRQAAAEQAAWDKKKAEHRAKMAVQQEVERAREEVEKRRREASIAAEAERLRTLTAAEKLAELRARRERWAKADVAGGVAIERDPADDRLEAELVAELKAEEREKRRVEAKAREEEPETEEQKQKRLAKQRHEDFWFDSRNG